jgi:hypothetical protein
MIASEHPVPNMNPKQSPSTMAGPKSIIALALSWDLP